MIQYNIIKFQGEILMISIEYDTLIFKEDKAFVAYCPELDISSCGDSVENAKKNA